MRWKRKKFSPLLSCGPFSSSENPDAFAVDSALLQTLSERFPLRQEEAPAVIVPGAGLSHRNVRRPDLEVAVRNLPRQRAPALSCCATWKVIRPRPSAASSIFPRPRCYAPAFPPASASTGACRTSPHRSRLIYHPLLLITPRRAPPFLDRLPRPPQRQGILRDIFRNA